MNEVEFVIAGGGGAGLGLAYAMLDSPLCESSIVIIDRDTKDQNDRTWCFWGGEGVPFTGIAAHAWDKLVVRSETFEREFDLSTGPSPDWKYWMVRGIDYYRHTRESLSAAPNVRFVQGSVESIREERDRALVTLADGTVFAAHWVFDSIIRPGDIKIDPSRHHSLKQHFKGWTIETSSPAFDLTRATLFDFRTPQFNDLRFFYILPFSETRALVEYTIFSAQLLPDAEYEAAQRTYIGGVLGIDAYSIIDEEHGSIPMTDYPFARRASAHVMNIGTKGGLVKPSTGYAFKRMQLDARAIVASLVKHGNPFKITRAAPRYFWYDSLLLQILYRDGNRMKPIFSKLFERNPILRVFHFLDEDASLLQDMALIASLPPLPFLKALVKIKLLRRI